MDANKKQEEFFPIVDEEGNITGVTTRTHAHNGSMVLHPVIHLHIFNAAGDIYLQKRAATKDIQPNLWDSAVGGHIDLDETPAEALLREAEEELGIIDPICPEYLGKYVIETAWEKELTYVYRMIYGGELHPDGKEVTEGRFWKIEEIRENLGKGIFTTNFEKDFIYMRMDQ
ncbi:MAG: NUDIX domain-containing protein [Candidatus Azobacteroides sp.]|nr:NUDIX domain-containing protein [Candidatus Azobacteroides sp.]